MPAHAGDSPPSLVGRISATEGRVAVRPAGGDWADSGINQPIAAGMSVRTDAQARSRLQIGADTLALAADSEIDVARSDASGFEIVLRKGRIGVRSSEIAAAHPIKIDLSRGAVWLLAPGDYDIAAGDQQAPSRVAVFAGHARFIGKGIDTAIEPGWASVFTGNEPVVARVDGAVADNFADWWRPSGDAVAASQALHHLPADMAGAEALDGHGSWENSAEYGAVWFPADLPANWAPYRDGHWRWMAPWGWTWLDDAPWGFVPSHYGRWATLPGSDGGPDRWGWVPGKLPEHPDFMPAGVAFLGTPGIGLSYPDASGPAVAWFPLAPGETYWPSYTHDLDAIRRLNAGAVADASTIEAGADGTPPASIVDGDYKNRRYASIVPRAVFVGGQPVTPALVALPERRLNNAPLLAGSPQIGSPIATRPVVAASAVAAPKVASVVRTLARIVPPRRDREVLAHWRAPSAHPAARLRVVRAVFARVERRQVHLASLHRRR